MQAVAADDIANKLLTLYAYEKSRAPGVMNDTIYYANACVLLHEENIYRFERVSGFVLVLVPYRQCVNSEQAVRSRFSHSSQKCLDEAQLVSSLSVVCISCLQKSNPLRLDIQLMDGGADKIEVPPSALEYNFSQYLNEFLLTGPDTKDRHHVFLARCVYLWVRQLLVVSYHFASMACRLIER